MQPRKGDDSSQNGFQNYAIDEYKMPVHIKPDRKRPNTIETAPLPPSSKWYDLQYFTILQLPRKLSPPPCDTWPAPVYQR